MLTVASFTSPACPLHLYVTVPSSPSLRRPCVSVTTPSPPRPLHLYITALHSQVHCPAMSFSSRSTSTVGVCPLHSQVHCSVMSCSSRSTSIARGVSSPQPGSLFSDEFLLQVYVHRVGCFLSTARFTVQR